jgi:hypothetical protein
MRILGAILAGVLIAVGSVWILQSLDIVPDTFLTGYIRWGWRGPASAAAGLLLLVAVSREDR